MKFLLLANGRRKIRFLSEAYCGSVHDYAILKAEFPPDGRLWFDEFPVHVDLGFLGIAKDYSVPKLSIPTRKPRNGSLTAEAKESNKSKSSIRVRIEHSIGGLKRYRFLSDRLRCRNIQLYNLVAEICAGLWNICIND